MRQIASHRRASIRTIAPLCTFVLLVGAALPARAATEDAAQAPAATAATAPQAAAQPKVSPYAKANQARAQAAATGGPHHGGRKKAPRVAARS